MYINIKPLIMRHLFECLLLKHSRKSSITQGNFQGKKGRKKGRKEGRKKERKKER